MAFTERCPDCEYNGYLSNFGEPIKGYPVGGCRGCGGRGRVRLVTADNLANAKPAERVKLLARLGNGRARLVRPSELVDPYLVKVKKK